MLEDQFFHVALEMWLFKAGLTTTNSKDIVLRTCTHKLA